MQWGKNRKLEFSLLYDERNNCWKAHVQTSNRHGFTKRFRTCKQANDWYAKYKEEYCYFHNIPLTLQKSNGNTYPKSENDQEHRFP